MKHEEVGLPIHYILKTLSHKKKSDTKPQERHVPQCLNGGDATGCSLARLMGNPALSKIIIVAAGEERREL